MKSIQQQPKIMFLAIALALGVAALSTGCSRDYDDTNKTAAVPNAAADGNMDAVTQDSTRPVSDTWITTKVKAKLQTIDGLENTDLSVETSNGIVTLSGRADSQAQIDNAVAAVKTIEGVKSVDASLLRVGADTDQ